MGADTYIPVNLRQRDPEQVEPAAEYALQVGQNIIAALENRGVILAGSRILELGPGTDCGPALMLAGRGAAMWVADRFPAVWQDNYHSALYAELRRLWQGGGAPLDAVLERRGYEGVLAVLPVAVEDMNAGLLFDGVLSNAVLEHLADVGRAVTRLAEITRPGGWNFHIVDFRDHRDFQRPLEYLLYDEAGLDRKMGHFLGEFGQPFRPSELEAMFTDAGFEIVERTVLCQADDAYLAAFLPRLRGCASRYRHWPEAELRELGVQYWLRRL